jgi:hypothetical protein
MKAPECFGCVSVAQGSRCAECGIFPECSRRMVNKTGMGVLLWPRTSVEETREREAVLVETVDQKEYEKIQSVLQEKTSLHETRSRMWKFRYRRNGKLRAIEVIQIRRCSPTELHAVLIWTPFSMIRGMRLEGILARAAEGGGTYLIAETPEAFIRVVEKVITHAYL